MPKKYQISWQINDTQAQGVFKRGVQGMQSLEKAALAAANAMEGAHVKAAAAAGNGYAKANAAATQAANGAAAAHINGVNRVSQATQAMNSARVRSAKSSVDAIQAVEDKYYIKDYRNLVKRERDRQRMDDFARSRTEKAIRDQEGVEQAWLVRDYKARVAAEKRKESAALGPYGRLANIRRKDLSEEQLQLAARNKAYDKVHNDRINQILKERGYGQDNFRESISQALGLSNAATAVGAALIGLNAGKAVVQAVAGAFRDAHEAAQAMARQLLDTKADLREIAAIREKFAPDEGDLKLYLDVRRASGMTHAEAKQFEEGIGNSLGTVGKDRFSDAERKKLETIGAAFVARTSTNPATARAKSEMLGMLPNFVQPDKGKSLTAQKVAGMADAVDLILGRGAASAQVMTEQYREVLTALTSEEGLTGFFSDPRQAAAMTSVASSFEKGAPATATLEATRALRGFTRFRKQKGLDASQAQTLAAAGITEQMNPYQAMTSLFGFADKNIGKDEAFDTFLARRGFRNETANTRLAQFYGQYKKGTLQSIMGLAGAPVNENDVLMKNQAYLGTDTGRDMLGKVAIDAVRIERGENAKELVIAKQEAQAKLIGQGIEDTFTGQVKKLAYGAIGGFGLLKSGESVLQEQEALAALRARAGQGGGPSALSSFQTGSSAFGLAGGVAATGIGAFMGTDPTRLLEAVFGPNAETAKRLATAIEKNNALLEKAQKGIGPTPAPLPNLPARAGALRP